MLTLPSMGPEDALVMEDVNRQPWVEAVFRSEAPGRVPSEYVHRDRLEWLGLIDERGVAKLRLNDLDGRPFITDGAWMLRDGGLFPWSDESAALLAEVDRLDLLDEVEVVADLATGCGHTVVSLAARLDAGRTVLGMDIAPRAERFVAANSALAGVSVKFLENDICRGLPKTRRGRKLAVANLPHALSPPEVRLPGPIDGGGSGSAVTRCALRSLGAWMQADDVTVLLSYSLADSGLGRVEVLEAAQKEFGRSAVTWKTLPGVGIWRVNGDKRHANPMPLRCLSDKASCRVTIAPDAATAARAAYEKLRVRLEAEGWSSLVYGILTLAP